MDNVPPQPTLPEMMALLDATMTRIEGAYAPSSIRAYRAAKAVEGWLSALSETEGFLFRGLPVIPAGWVLRRI